MNYNIYSRVIFTRIDSKRIRGISALAFCRALANEAFQATNRRGDFVMRAHARAFAAKSTAVVTRRRKGTRWACVRDRDQDREPTRSSPRIANYRHNIL